MKKDKKDDVYLKPHHLIYYDKEWFILGKEEDDMSFSLEKVR